MIHSIKRALFIGAHTDDEMICAGTLARLKREGTEIGILTFAPAGTEDDRAGYKADPDGVVYKEWQESLNILKVSYHKYGVVYGCGLIPSPAIRSSGQQVCQTIYSVWKDYKPDGVLILSSQDGHAEHAIVGAESERALRGRVPFLARCLLPWDYQMGRPNLYVGLEVDDMEVKKAVINCYRSQRFRYDYLPMLAHYAYADGMSIKIPPPYVAAEKFEVVRSVV